MPSSFWADPKKTYAKRNNLFTVQIDFNSSVPDIEPSAKDLFNKVSGIQFVATSVSLPSFQIGAEVDRNNIGGEQRIVAPKVMDWTPIKITFADFVERGTYDSKEVLSKESPQAGETFVKGQPGVTEITTTRLAKYPDSSLYQALMHAFFESFNRDPAIYQGAQQINLDKFRKIFQNVIITSHFDNGDMIEKWTLKGLWPLGFENSDLSYEDDGIRKFSFEVDYETAEYSHIGKDGQEVKIFNHNPRSKTDKPTIKKRNLDGSLVEDPKSINNGWSAPIRRKK